MQHVPVGDPVWSSVGEGEPIDIAVASDSEASMKPVTINIDQLLMAQNNGTITLPLQVTGSWRLAVRVWVATRLLLVAAWLLNLGVKVDAECAKCGDTGTIPCEGCDGRYASCAGCKGAGVRICSCGSYAKRWSAAHRGAKRE